MKRMIALTTLMTIVQCSFTALAAEPQATSLVKTLIVEHIYKVRVAELKPAIDVKRVQRQDSSYDTPERATVTQFSAMSAQNYNWWLDGWTEESKVLLKKRDAEMKRTPADWAERWKGIKDVPVRLIYRAEYFWEGTQYVAIGYRLETSGGGDAKSGSSKPFESAMVFKRVGQNWLATQDLKEDPVFANAALIWKSAEPVVRVQKKMN